MGRGNLPRGLGKSVSSGEARQFCRRGVLQGHRIIEHSKASRVEGSGTWKGFNLPSHPRNF